jgi:hypothetical protein
MSKLKFTSVLRLSSVISAFFFFSFLSIQANAQCSLACNGTTQVSLDLDCEAEITPQMILNDAMTSCPAGNFFVVIEDQMGNQLLPTPGTEGPGVAVIVTDSHKNQTLYVRVTDAVSGNSCWGNIIVEDKIAPVMDCTQPVGPFFCFDLVTFTPATTSNNCDIAPVFTIISDLVTVNDCSTSFIDDLNNCGFFPDVNGTTYAMALANTGLVSYVLKIQTRTYIATDDCGNESLPCTYKLVIEAPQDLENNIVCPSSALFSNGTHLMCDSGFETIATGPFAGNPTPRGGFQSLFPLDGSITLTDIPNAAGTQLTDTYMFEYQPAMGTCETATFTTTGPGTMRLYDANGVLIASGSSLTNVTLCADQRYTLVRQMLATSPAIPFDYTISIDAPGVAGNYLLDVPYLQTGMALIELYPDPEINCNLLTTFSDVNLGMIGCVEKILRTWSIIQWSCGASTAPITCVQIIEIADGAGPMVTCPMDVTVSTNSSGVGNCFASYVPPVPAAVDNCCSETTLDVSWAQNGVNQGVVTGYTGGTAIDLPVGVSVVTYIAYDCCLNSTTCSFEVTVEDNTPPVAICDQFTVVSLSTDGTAHLLASVFDDGSYDDCQVVGMLVKRMDNGSNCGIMANTFEESITVCCEDLGTNVMVQFRVYDSYNADGSIDLTRFNECMVEVEVQDKIAPTITCAPNMTMDCDESFDLDGDLVAQFGMFTITDNCSNPDFTDVAVANVDQCNQGRITRTIRVLNVDGSVAAQCRQIITLTNPEPFFVNPNDVCDATDDDVQFPADFDFEGCGDPESTDFAPEVTGFPLISEDQCDLVGVNFSDQIFPFNTSGSGIDENVCFKIIRTWTILDWCQADHPNNQDADPTNDVVFEWVCTQVIKVNNAVAPVITSSCAPKSTCSFDQACSNGFIELTATATDDCTAELDWWADIDLNNTGSFDEDYATSGTGNFANASGEYPIGTHTIFWSFKDQCGNVATCSQEFSIVSCKAPTCYLINGLATDLMPTSDTTGMIEIWANDFDNGSFHSCGYDIALSFSPDVTDINFTFTCLDEGLNTVSIYVTAVSPNGTPLTMPDGTPIQAFCNTTIDIQDNMNTCNIGDDGILNRISGNISTEDDRNLVNVQVHLGDGQNVVATDADGLYAFANMPNGGDYEVDPTKNVDALNGVSTLDLVLIQKHIIQLEALNTPYKLIAADINHDENISAIDLIELRKLILGVTVDFQDNDSWRFVDRDYQFINPNAPLDEAFPESYAIDNLITDMEIDWVAVKVGDVNNSVVLSATGETTENRSDKSLSLFTDNVTFSKGELVSVPFKATNSTSLIGYQFTLDFDSETLEYQGFDSNSIELANSNFGTHSVDFGQLTTSWGNTSATSIEENDVLFTLNFIAKESGSLENIISTSSDITNAEAYDEYNELMDINLNVRSASNGYALYQNTPNPFSVTTDIAFEIPSSQNIKITIYDVTGKVITTVEKQFSKGYNTVTIDQDMLNTSGVLYYSLEAGQFTATKKMVLLK